MFGLKEVCVVGVVLAALTDSALSCKCAAVQTDADIACSASFIFRAKVTQVISANVYKFQVLTIFRATAAHMSMLTTTNNFLTVTVTATATCYYTFPLGSQYMLAGTMPITATGQLNYGACDYKKVWSGVTCSTLQIFTGSYDPLAC